MNPEDSFLQDIVEIVMIFGDGTWSTSGPIRRWRAIDIINDFGHGVPWVNGLYVEKATIRTVNGVLN